MKTTETFLGKKISFAIFLATVVMTLPLLGCKDGRPKRVPVSGVVLIDGKPLTYGKVRFHTQGGRPAVGELDQEGRFTLSCFGNNDGVVPGTHAVSVDASEPISETQARWHAPQRYAFPKTSGITRTIDGPTESLTIELFWKENGGSSAGKAKK